MLALQWVIGLLAAPQTARILLVDDEPIVVRSLRRALTQLRPGWQIDVAESGSVALRHLAKAPYDVLVTDLEMPGIDGIELLLRVAKCYPATQRLVHSSHSTADSSPIEGAQDVLQKPMRPFDVVELIEQLLVSRVNAEPLAVLSRSA